VLVRHTWKCTSRQVDNPRTVFYALCPCRHALGVCVVASVPGCSFGAWGTQQAALGQLVTKRGDCQRLSQRQVLPVDESLGLLCEAQRVRLQLQLPAY